MKTNLYFVAGVLMLFLSGSYNSRDTEMRQVEVTPVPINSMSELKRGDLLIRPNHNWWPGTSIVPGGSNFGHAAIVVEGARDTNITTLLSKAVIFESQARDVPGDYQLRKVNAYRKGDDFRFANTNFSSFNQGHRYLIRPGLDEASIDSIISFVLRQDNGLSSWRALKNYNVSRTNEATYWYCSQLIWQAYYDVLGVDIDPNKGLIVYPNDLIKSPYFEEINSYITRF